jgi:hypothetical protein
MDHGQAPDACREQIIAHACTILDRSLYSCPPMRPAICKCPNYSGCLTAYHGDDIEITRDMPAVCPECGTPVRLAPKPRNDLLFSVANLVGLAAVAGAIWFSWPSIVKVWHKVTTPPQKAAPGKS